jgi:hypothetical protein
VNGRGENDLWQSFSFFAVLAAGGLGEDDPDAIDAAAARFGLEILGPPPPGGQCCSKERGYGSASAAQNT